MKKSVRGMNNVIDKQGIIECRINKKQDKWANNTMEDKVNLLSV